MIFKRKSFHLFRDIGNEHITDDKIKDIENEFNTFKPLVEDIKVKKKIYILACKKYICMLKYKRKLKG